MAIVTASTNCGLSASFTAVTAAQSNVIVFMAFKPVGNVNTWGRQVALMKSGAAYAVAGLRLRGDNAFEGWGTNDGNTTSQVFFSSASAGSWKRVAMRLRYSNRAYGRASGDGSLSQGTLNDMGYWPGATGVDMFRVNANYNASTYGEAASYAHFGCYFGDWTDQEIADFCAGTWNPANNSKVTHYWDGSSKTAQVGGLTLTDLGSNNATVEADTGHGVPDYATGDTQAPNVPAGLTLGTRTASTLPFTWSASTDNGGGSVNGYKVQILDNADTVLSTIDVGNVLSYTITGLAGNTLRKLKVAAYDNAVPANQSAYSSAVSGTTLSKTATVTVKDVNGSAQASETSLRWAAATGTIGASLAVVAQGTAETTDGSGNCVLDLNSTALAAGNSITVLLADDSPSPVRYGVLEGVTVTES